MCTSHLADGPQQIHNGHGPLTELGKDASMNALEYLDPCSPCAASRALEPLSDKECADITLVQATLRGDVSDVKRALDHGASVNTTADITLRMGDPNKKCRKGKAKHVTPLMRASGLGHEDVVETLLQARALPSQCDSHGWTPMCYALGAGEVEIARTLWKNSMPRLHRHKEIVRRLQADIVAKCVNEAGPDAAAKVKHELGTEGFMYTTSLQGMRDSNILDVEVTKSKGGNNASQVEASLRPDDPTAGASTGTDLIEKASARGVDPRTGMETLDLFDCDTCQADLLSSEDTQRKLDLLTAASTASDLLKDVDLLGDTDNSGPASLDFDGTTAFDSPLANDSPIGTVQPPHVEDIPATDLASARLGSARLGSARKPASARLDSARQPASARLDSARKPGSARLDSARQPASARLDSARQPPSHVSDTMVTNLATSVAQQFPVNEA